MKNHFRLSVRGDKERQFRHCRKTKMSISNIFVNIFEQKDDSLNPNRKKSHFFRMSNRILPRFDI